MDEKKTFYITTPIYYASGDLHLGHCCTTVFADAIARYKRLEGREVFFLTGADEHGQKVENKAKESGLTPKEYVDGIDIKIKSLWKLMNISYDKYIRTTDREHEKAVQKIFNKLYEKGDIYLSEYEGLYCVSDEAFFTESQAPDGICPDCHRKLTTAKEESYFFKLTKYQKRLEEYYNQNPDFIRLETTKNEMLNGFIKPGLQDLCVSRTTFSWGIPVEFNPNHVIYVWIDALSNYITALGYMSEDSINFEKFWPADIHLMAKEIARFHMIIWPAILMALDLPLPKLIHAHGWLTITGAKMGKSLGNGFNPYILCQRYGVDAVRYYLLKDGPIMSDTPYSPENFLTRINADLCNELGNLLSRTTAMIVQNFGEKMIDFTPLESEIAQPLLNKIYGLNAEVQKSVDRQELNNALTSIWQLIRIANRYIDDTMPWKLKGAEDRQTELLTILHNLKFSLFAVAVNLQAFIPETAKKVLSAIGVNHSPKLEDINGKSYIDLIKTPVIKPDNLFPRLKIDEELKYILGKSEK